MSYAAFDRVDDALTATRRFLLPFSLGRWSRLALIAFFVGGGGASVANNGANAGSNVANGPGTGTTEVPDALMHPFGFDLVTVVIAVVALAVLVGLALGAIGAVMRFVLLDALRTDDVRIRGPFRERLGKGLRLFGFNLVVGLLLAAPVIAAVAAVVLGMATVEAILPLVFALVLVYIPVLFVVGLVLGLTTSFVAPVMLVEDVGVLSGWRRFWPTLRSNLVEYVLYLVVRFLLGIAAGIAVGLVVGLVAVVVFLVAALVAAVPVFVVAGGIDALFGSPLALGLVAVVFVVAGLAVLVASLFARVPVLTYFTHYELLVLGSTNDAFALIPAERYTDEGVGDGDA